MYQMKEGKKDVLAYQELYQELVQIYRSWNCSFEMFEWRFIDECAWIPRAIANIKKEHPPFERDYIKFFIDGLCKMESELLRLELNS